MVPTLDTVLQALYDSEINAGILWFWDGGFELRLGDNINGIKAEAVVGTTQEAARWFIDNAKRIWPQSQFAESF